MSRWVTGGDVWEVTGDFGELEVIGDLGGRSFWEHWGGRPPLSGVRGDGRGRLDPTERRRCRAAGGAENSGGGWRGAWDQGGLRVRLAERNKAVGITSHGDEA